MLIFIFLRNFNFLLALFQKVYPQLFPHFQDPPHISTCYFKKDGVY